MTADTRPVETVARLAQARQANRARAAEQLDDSIPASPDGGISVDWQKLLLPLVDPRRPATGGFSTTPPETPQERERVAHVAVCRAG